MANPNNTLIGNHDSFDNSSYPLKLNESEHNSTLLVTTQEKPTTDTHLQYLAKYRHISLDSHEPSSMAVNSNTQSFYNPSYQIKFQECLYADNGELNEDFKQNLKIFHVVFSSLFIVKFFCTLIGFFRYSTSVNYFSVNLTAIFLLSFLQGGVLFYVWKYCSAKEKVFYWYLILVVLSTIYFGTMNPRVMTQLLGLDGLEKVELDSNLYILVLNVVTKDLFYNNPLITLVQCLAGVLISLIMYFIDVNLDNFATLSSLIVLSICSVYLVVYCFRVDSKQKHFFTEYDSQRKIAEKVQGIRSEHKKEGVTERELTLNKCSNLKSILELIQPLMVCKLMKKEIDHASKELAQIMEFIIDLPIIPMNQVSIMLQARDGSRVHTNNDSSEDHEANENNVMPNRFNYFFQNFIRNWNFDMFKVSESSLFLVCAQLVFDRTNAHKELNWLNLNKFFVFLGELEENYCPGIKYHNSLHAVDVLHSMLFLLFKCNLNEKLNPAEWITCIVAALGHDVGHKGKDNLYLKETYDDLTIMYNDHMVLENMHCASIFKLIKQDEYNFTNSNITTNEWNAFRMNLIDLVLGTDFSTFQETAGKLNCFVNKKKASDCFRLQGRPFILSIVLKCADVGHFGKEPELYNKWSNLLLSEYKNLPDQHQSNLILGIESEFYSNNLNFLKQSVLPLYQSFEAYVSLNGHSIEEVLKYLKENKKGGFNINSPVGSTTENAGTFLRIK